MGFRIYKFMANKMYTGAGDMGKTTLLGGEVTTKSNLRVGCYGTLDEVNAILGVVRAQRIPEPVIEQYVAKIQQDLFTVGALLANPGQKAFGRQMQFDPALETSNLERMIDDLSAQLPPLNQFIVPGGTRSGAFLHVARTIVRRAERLLVALSEQEQIDTALIAYLNRLSSAFFVFARYTNFKAGLTEELW